MSIEKLKVLAITFVFAASAGIGNSARAELDIADAPMFVAVSIDPNILFMLDDSGSMRWGFMPDELDEHFNIGGLWDNCGNSGSWGGFDLCYFYTNNGRQWLASSHLNKIYYNPEFSYDPPIQPDGTPFPDSSFTNAKVNGYSDGSCGWNNDGNWFYNYCIDLSSNYRAMMDPYYYKQGYGRGFAISHNAAAERAFYYVNSGSSGCDGSRDSACYQKVRYGDDGFDAQNFANWFSYYRTREMVAKAGVSFAFHEQSSALRVGYGAINDSNLERGVRQFQGTDREDFFEWLFGDEADGGTPLRAALERAGRYYESAEPWRTDPVDSGSELLSCRQSYTILMTDGYYDAGEDVDAGNADGTAGSSISDPEGNVYQYAPGNPFNDSYSDTLADVAMDYWKNDLRGNLDNRVPTTSINPAFWQHMVTFGVGLGVAGTIDPDEAFAAIEDPSISIDWPDPSDSRPGKIDDLLHAAVNSRGGFFSAADPEQFARSLSSILADVIARANATTSVAVSATRLTTDSLVYAAQFDSADWTGELAALNAEDGSVEHLATEQLESTGHSGRSVFTYDPENGSALVFDAGAAGSIGERLVQSAPAGDIWTAENIINYIRGDDALEGTDQDAFRPRDVMLGDIVNSRPAFSGSGNEGWARVDDDYLDYIDGRKNDPRDCDEVEGTCYYARKDTVFIGANDGMLHAFDARTLEEFFAYVPAAVHDKLHHLADPDYGHKFFVDGQVAISDAKIGSGWGTYLVGTLGAGGRGVFALDVTNPENFGANDVLWELTAEDDPDLGYTFGEPIISRLENGTWVAVFGNGYNSGNGQAHLFVVRLSDGEILHKVRLSNTTDNGLSGIVGWRDPGTRTYLKRVYAGDLNGTMWRVDFNSSEPSKAFNNGLFTDPNGRAITATPNVAAHPSGGLMVYFGTGKLIENSDRLEANLERFFAIRDQNSSVSGNNNLNNLAEVEISTAPAEEGMPPLRILESEDIKEDGWYIDLAVGNNATGERTLAKARVVFGTVIIATYEPVEDPCTPGGIQRTYVMDALSGDGALPFCPSCGAVEVGSGAPFSPPLAIKQRPPGSVGDVTYPGHDDPADPGEPGDFPGAPPSDTGSREGWCSEFGIPPLFEGGSFLPLGTICEGRQVWREMR